MTQYEHEAAILQGLLAIVEAPRSPETAEQLAGVVVNTPRPTRRQWLLMKQETVEGILGSPVLRAQGTQEGRDAIAAIAEKLRALGVVRSP